ncbi:MlaD family protein [Photobacterium rosenbergii]|uniref:MlaD family protein n=1 Tax=Photobacterium rosenbergii TaxID=294936 RepID=A0ABU3ZEJ4_9GAMM|nr:MlaD family protein [Photobacterium rosenbergii]MDV5168525.1 MlaD family protein [Photobacterium rosenbergii]
MDDSKKHFRLGLFVTISLILLFAVFLTLGGRSFFKPKLIFETYFDNSVSGLEIGSMVSYRGIPLGEVISIESSSTVYEYDVPHEKRVTYVVVKAEILGDKKTVRDWERHFDTFIQRGLRVQTQIAGITGQQYLSLDYISQSQSETLDFDWQPENIYVPSAKSSTGRIIAGIQNLLASLDDAEIANLGQNLNLLLTTANEKLSDVDTESISEEVVTLLLSANDITSNIKKVVLNSKLDDTFDNLNLASEDLDRLLSNPNIQKSIVSLYKILNQFDVMLAKNGDVNKILVNLDDLIKRSDAILTDNQYDLYQMIKNLSITAENLKEFSDTTKNNPSSIIFSNAPEKINLDGGN